MPTTSRRKCILLVLCRAACIWYQHSRPGCLILSVCGCSHTRCLVQDPAHCWSTSMALSATPWAEKLFLCRNLALRSQKTRAPAQAAELCCPCSLAWEIRKRRRQPVKKWTQGDWGKWAVKGNCEAIWELFVYIHTYKYMCMFGIYIWIAEEDGEGQSPCKTFTHASKTKKGSVPLQEHMTSTASKKCKKILHKVL